MSKSALITGITGQDGSYLAEYLLQLGYRVFGLVRRSSQANYSRIFHILNQIRLIDGDMHDQGSLQLALRIAQPDEVYNLAAQSFVHISWGQPILTAECTGLGTTRLLEAIRAESLDQHVRFYQASSSEMFGGVTRGIQNESTPLHPRSPYGVAKVYAHWMTINYRESFNMFNCCGILYNHESPRRGVEFVTRKISKAAARIKHGLQNKLELGNLDALRDWGHAADFVRAMHLMLQHSEPDDYVIATGEQHSVREFASLAFEHVGLNYLDHVEVTSTNYRPAEVSTLLGDYTKARDTLGWSPSCSFGDLVREMVDADMKSISGV